MPETARRHRRVVIATAIVGALAAVTAFGTAPLGSDVPLPEPAVVVEQVPLDLKSPEPVDRFIQSETIRRGDSLPLLLARLGANDSEFLRFASTERQARTLLQMRPGRTVRAEIDSLGRVHALSWRTGALEDADGPRTSTQAARRVSILRSGDRLVLRDEAIPLERSTETRSVEIRSSLFAATDAAGIPEAVAIKVADIFGGDLDMRRDLRKGARLRVVYEMVRESGSFDPAVLNRVLAVELQNGEKRYDALWFERAGTGEYFDFNGVSRKKDFLLNPLEFSRVTSGFSSSRLHPIHGDWRAHRGVDFGAPSGTGIRATADGTVESIGWQGGYGKMIVLRHRGPYSTVYAHLREFTEGLKVGSRVQQGDIIGAVGQTGWATGPHLHYELKVSGTQVDPLKVALLPAGKPLDGAERQRLAAHVVALRAQMARQDDVLVARFQ